MWGGWISFYHNAKGGTPKWTVEDVYPRKEKKEDDGGYTPEELEKKVAEVTEARKKKHG